MNLSPSLLSLIHLAALCYLAWSVVRWQNSCRQAWKQEVQLIEWLEELGWLVHVLPDGELYLTNKGPDPEEARLAGELYGPFTPNKSIPRPKLGDL
jgi:hypothetical protein